MISYVCHYCDDLVSETSICPQCGKRATIEKTTIFWSYSFNTPSFDEYNAEDDEHCVPIGSDLRPVFPEERLLLEVLIGKPMKYAGKSVWHVGSNIYVVDGKKTTFQFSKLIKNNDSKEVIQTLKTYA